MTPAWEVLSARFVGEYRDAAAMPASTAPEFAFAGRSNVGKSTLLNTLARHRGLARVSQTPGCTRGLVVFEILNGDRSTQRWVDLPGYGYARRAKDEVRGWGALIEQFLIERDSLRAVLVLFDLRRGPEDEEQQLLDFLGVNGRAVLLVATKADKLAPTARKQRVAELQRSLGQKVFAVSGESGDGRAALLEAVARAAH